jgi:RNA polymerase sigma-70 factor, ECF subfamily
MNQKSQQQIKNWAQKIRESDRKAFDDFFRWGYPRLVRFAIGYTGEKSSACDIVQDAFVVLWQKRDEIDPNRSLKSLVYQIVRNRCLNYLRDRANTLVDSDIVQDSPSATEAISIENMTTENGSLEKKFQEWIQALPNRQREAFELSRFEGLEHDEIADVMEISPKTVNNHIVAALQQLRIFYVEYQKKINNPGL